MTRAKALIALSGLSHQEAADYLNVSLETIRSWIKGRRNPAPGVIEELADLIQRQERAAAKALSEYRKSTDADNVTTRSIDLTSIPTGDWPPGAERMVIARILAGVPATAAIHI